MEEYIDQVEKFLRGKMSQEEELTFKEILKSDEQLCSLAIIVTVMLMCVQKNI